MYNLTNERKWNDWSSSILPSVMKLNYFWIEIISIQLENWKFVKSKNEDKSCLKLFLLLIYIYIENIKYVAYNKDNALEIYPTIVYACKTVFWHHWLF